MNRHMEDDLPKGSFYGLVINKILVDAFKPKFGDEKDFAVFSLLVKQRDAANKLMSYIVQKNFDLLDVEVAPDPKPDPKPDPNIDGQYILFIEMNRNKDMFATMDKLLLHIDHLVSIKQWYFRASSYKEYMDWNRDNFVKVVCQTPDEYSNKGPISERHDEVGNVPQNSKDADIDRSLLEEVIERQVAKFNQSYIKSLKEQIKTIKENKLQLSRHIEDLKIDRDHLYKQLELSHDREKIALIREQQDFKRIRSLKNQLALLAAPGSREMEIVIPDKTAYDNDAKPVIGEVPTEAEVKDQDEHKEASEEDQHPDEAPALNESSDLDIVFDLHDEINHEKSSGFIKEMHSDNPAVDASIEKPAEQPDHEAFITAEREKPEKEKPEKEKNDKPDNEKANQVDEEVREPETPAELQDLKPIESDDSTAAARLDDIVVQNLLEESTAKVDDKPYLADDPVPKYMVLGQDALENADYDIAIEYFLKVVDILPTAGTVVLNLAHLYFLKKEYETARKYAAQALELGEDSATLVLDKINAALAPDAGLSSIEKSGEEIAKDLIARGTGYNEGTEDLEDTIFIELAALNEAADSTENTTPGSVDGAVLKDDNEIIDQIKADARKYMTLGVKAAEQKDYNKAVEHFTKAVEILPDNPAGFFNLAVLNYRLKEYETAYMCAEKAIELGSLSATKILEKIKPVMVAPLKSPAEFEPAAEVDKTKTPLVAKKNESETFFIESAAATLDDFLEAEKQNQSDLTVDASLKEKDAVVNDSFRLGVAALEKKEFHKAIWHFNEVVELLPNGIPSYIHLATIHYSLGQYPQARKYAEKAFDLGDYTLKPILEKIDAKLAEESAPSPSTKSMGLKEREKPAEAIEDTEEEPEVPESHADAEPDKKAVEDESEPETIVEMPDVESIEPVALAEAADSRDNKTPASIEKAVSKDDDARKYMTLGVEATEQKDYHKAVEHFSKAVEILPDNAAGFCNLAILQYQLEDYKTARKHAEKSLNLGLHSAQSILTKIKSKIVTGSIASPAKKDGKTPAEEAPIETGKAKPDHIIGAQSELPYEKPKEAIAHGKTSLKQAQDLVEPAVTTQPPAGDEFASETPLQATSPQTENPQVPREYGSVDEYFKAGLAASEKNDFNIALEYFNKVAMALPEAPSSFLNMADLHYRMKNYKTAQKHAERALELGAQSAHRILSKIEDSLEAERRPDPVK